MKKAAIFDVFGTVVDWRSSVAREVSDCFSKLGCHVDGETFADFWRGLYVPSMEPVIMGERPYVPLDDLHLENLVATLDHFALSDRLNESQRIDLATAWERLVPWPDSVTGLTRLRQQTIIAPCSNGSIALMTRLAKFAQLPWDCILGAELAQSYKPDPAVYLACCRALRLEPQQVMMVAAHNSDLHAARAQGLKTAFVCRPTEYGPNQTNDLKPDSDWDLILSDLNDPELVGFFS